MENEDKNEEMQMAEKFKNMFNFISNVNIKIKNNFHLQINI